MFVKNLSWAVSLIFLSAGAASASTVLADFDTVSPSVTGMSVSAPGSGSCALFSGGSGNALCGTNTDSVGPNGAILSFDVNYDILRNVSFDLAARAGNDNFDFAGGTFGDFIRVFGRTVQSGSVLLAEFQADPGNRTEMLSTAAGALLGDGVEIGNIFTTIVLSDFDGVVDGEGTLEFQLLSTAPGGTRGVNAFEDLGIDEVKVEVVPLPAPALMLIGGLAAIAVLRRRRRA
ncbi:MAG: VPLPA-CTERM sorting domain-containing protein [Pseudomonadota bacterium]